MRRRVGWGPLALVAAAVLVHGAGGAAVGLVLGGDTRPRATAGPTLPRGTGWLPPWTAAAAASPPGRAVALLGTSGPFSDRDLVLAADSDRVRALPEVQDRSGSDAEPTARLSPDGTRVAVGTAEDGDVLLLDLRTGERRRLPVGDGPVAVLAWSPDGTHLAYGGTRVGVLDVATGRTALLDARPFLDEYAPPTVAFTRDGTALTVDEDEGVRTYPLDGSPPVYVAGGGDAVLAGPAAWAPDGRRVLLVQEDEEAETGPEFLLSGADGVRPAFRLPYSDWGYDELVGWRGPDEVLLSRWSEDGNLVLESRRLDGSSPRRLADFGFDAFSVDLAADLAAGVGVRPAGAETGPVPKAVPVGSGLLVALGSGLLVALVALVVVLARRRPTPGGRSGGGVAYAPPAWIVPGPVPPEVGPAGPGPAGFAPVPGGFAPLPVLGGFAPSPVPGGFAPSPGPGASAPAPAPDPSGSEPPWGVPR